MRHPIQAVVTRHSSQPKRFGTRLRWWRARRGLSQLDLAGIAGISQRHLSFLESDRTIPSQEMVLRLAAALDLPLRQQNALLLAAGFAPYWHESPLAALELAQINRALDFMLAQQEPFPVFVVDRRWNLICANKGAARLTRFLTGAQPTEAAAEAVNLADALVSPDGLRPFIVNWEEVALQFLRSVQADAIVDGTKETAELLQRLSIYPAVPSLAEVPWLEEPAGPVLNIHFRKGETSLRLFTTITTLGTPQDVTLQEIRIECFFPADRETEQFFRDNGGSQRRVVSGPGAS
ncbi:MAG: helix-turn-helix transcriptional regulator [Proteobacteria bacterium]|nr:helix-turn-helix transcriptional regulator [Pseudomonadota bacterium]MBI3498223.1 helix-turn-helix transcriptional regulator [Pseudomonadota bacterium]